FSVGLGMSEAPTGGWDTRSACGLVLLLGGVTHRHGGPRPPKGAAGERRVIERFCLALGDTSLFWALESRGIQGETPGFWQDRRRRPYARSQTARGRMVDERTRKETRW